MAKAKAIEDLLDEMAVSMTGQPRIAGQCPTCANPIGEFRDALSVKEFKISGMCQSCQDEVFDGAVDDEEDFSNFPSIPGDQDERRALSTRRRFIQMVSLGRQQAAKRIRDKAR